MKMSFCMECGSELNEHGLCPNADCVSNNKAESKVEFSDEHVTDNHVGVKNAASFNGENAKKSIENYADSVKSSIEKEKDKLIVPECVDADENEVPVKQYDIARLQSIMKGSFAEGRLQITNKRVLFRANGISFTGPTTMQTEFSIEEIGGIEIRKEPRFDFFTTLIQVLFFIFAYLLAEPTSYDIYSNSIIGTIVALAITAGAVAGFVFLKQKRLFRYLLVSLLFAAMPINTYNANVLQQLMVIVVGALFVISFLSNAFARNLVVRVTTKGGSPATEIRRKDGWFSFQHNEYTGFSQVIPGPDVDLAIKELGSIIRAVQHGQIS